MPLPVVAEIMTFACRDFLARAVFLHVRWHARPHQGRITTDGQRCPKVQTVFNDSRTTAQDIQSRGRV